MAEIKFIPDVLNRMFNWKMTSAYEYAQKVEDFPKTALAILKSLSKQYGNCGWLDGKIFNELREKNNKIASILGYEWSNKEDYWVKKSKLKKINHHRVNM